MSISGSQTTRNSLRAAIDRWREAIASIESPSTDTVVDQIDALPVELGPPLGDDHIERWEETHGFRLPVSLKHWLAISDGLVVDGVRWIHPIRCIGPTVRFRPGAVLLQQPASWYEFGNPHDSPVNMDLIASTHGDDESTPIFVSTSESEEAFRVVANRFAEWFERVIASGFRPFWTKEPAGTWIDPVALHYARMQPPKLPPKLCLICQDVGDRLSGGADERELMRQHDLNRDELESLISAYQYRRQKLLSR